MQAKRQIDGVVLIDKIPGITSHDVVEKFRRRSHVKKVGHTGTLDPLATGLLVLCVGKATRLQAYLMGMEKTYEGVIQFGWATDSYDAAGAPVRDDGPAVSDTCPAISRAMPKGTKVVATDSAKQSHYLPAITGVQCWFGSVADCVEAAVTGRWNGELR